MNTVYLSIESTLCRLYDLSYLCCPRYVNITKSAINMFCTFQKVGVRIGTGCFIVV